MVGEGRREGELRALAASLGIAPRVDWHGVVRDPYAFYHTASIFALPSRVEGTPNALLEAMSCGLPVVVTDSAPGPLELVDDGETGLVVPGGDARALAEALRLLARDEALRRRLGEAARERVREYDLPRALAAWESVVGIGGGVVRANDNRRRARRLETRGLKDVAKAGRRAASGGAARAADHSASESRRCATCRRSCGSCGRRTAATRLRWSRCGSLRAFVPVAVLWVGKLIIDAVVAARGGAVDAARLWRLVALEIAIVARGRAPRRASPRSSRACSATSSRTTSSVRLMEHAATLDL